MKLITYDKKFGILVKGSIFDLNTFEEVKPESYTFLHANRLQNLPNQDLNKDFLKNMACKTTLKTFAMNHKVESEIWLNEKHDINFLEENKEILVEKYFEFLKKENEQYDVYNKIVREITH